MKPKYKYVLRWCFQWLTGIPCWLILTPVVLLVAIYVKRFLMLKDEINKYLEHKKLADIANTYKPERKKKNG